MLFTITGREVGKEKKLMIRRRLIVKREVCLGRAQSDTVDDLKVPHSSLFLQPDLP